MTTVRNNVCYFQSGGPTQVINSSFYGLYKAFKNDLSHGKFYVSRYGVNGLLNGKLELIPSNRNFKDLLVTPGAVISLHAAELNWQMPQRKKLSPVSGSQPCAKILTSQCSLPWLLFNNMNIFSTVYIVFIERIVLFLAGLLKIQKLYTTFW